MCGIDSSGVKPISCSCVPNVDCSCETSQTVYMLDIECNQENIQQFNYEVALRKMEDKNHRLRRAIEEALLELGDLDTCTPDRISRVYSILNVAIRRNND